MASAATTSTIPVPDWRHTRQRIAGTRRMNPAKDVSQLQLQMRLEHLAGKLAEVIEMAPGPLTDEQRAIITDVLDHRGRW